MRKEDYRIHTYLDERYRSIISTLKKELSLKYDKDLLAFALDNLNNSLIDVTTEIRTIEQQKNEFKDKIVEMDKKLTRLKEKSKNNALVKELEEEIKPQKYESLKRILLLQMEEGFTSKSYLLKRALDFARINDLNEEKCIEIVEEMTFHKT